MKLTNFKKVLSNHCTVAWVTRPVKQALRILVETQFRHPQTPYRHCSVFRHHQKWAFLRMIELEEKKYHGQI